MRTFNKALAGSVVAVVGIDWLTEWRIGLTTLILGALASFVAALAAYLMAYHYSIESPFGRALAQAGQYFAGGIVAIPVLDAIDPAKIYTFTQGVGRVAIAAVLSGLLTLLTNQAEDEAA
jgi:hypothetical protein